MEECYWSTTERTLKHDSVEKAVSVGAFNSFSLVKNYTVPSKASLATWECDGTDLAITPSGLGVHKDDLHANP